MTSEKRLKVYFKQRNGGQFTSRQKRRYYKKALHAVYNSKHTSNLNFN